MLKFLVAVTLALVVLFPVVAGEMKILKDSLGNYTLAREQPTDTGITVQEGLSLTSEQLAGIVNGKPILLGNQKKNQRWTEYLTHISYDEISTEQVVLDRKMVKKVSKTTEKKVEFFNPFFILAAIYIVCMILLFY